jgi:DNA-binding NarL/FixJ family response regulator
MNTASSRADTALHRLLVLEDDPFFQETIKKSVSLTISTSETDICVTVAEAIQRIDESFEPYQLAIIDLNLPDGDGLEVIRHLAQAHPQTPTLVISVEREEKRVLQAVRAGASGYVVKGDITLSISRAIEQMLNGLHPISPSLAGYFLRLAGREKAGSSSAPIERLTARELELLREFAAGKSYVEAAQAMNISITTVRTHTTNLYRKLGVKSGLAALSVAKEHGII